MVSKEAGALVMFDLLLKGGTVIDPGQGLNGLADVAISGGRIAAVRPQIPEAEAARVVDVSGKMVTPGLVDLHAHVYPGVTAAGVDADEYCLKHGSTTAVECGGPGAFTFGGFQRWVVATSRTRVFCFLSLAAIGQIGFAKVPEFVHPEYSDPEAAIRTIRANPQIIVGLKFRAARNLVNGSCLPLLRVARQAADEAKVPVMVHIGDTQETLGEILELLRPGDIVTHCATPKANGLLSADGKILPEVVEARERGIYFDPAHGFTNFGFQVAERLLDQGFPPDSISTDLTVHGATRLGQDLPDVMDRFLMLGMPLEDVVRLSTFRPAQILGKTGEFGSLRPGLEADIAVLRWEEGEFPKTDGTGETRMVRRRLLPHLVIRRGEMIQPFRLPSQA